MSEDDSGPGLVAIGWGVLAAITLLLAALIFLWPGPLALSDRIPFGLLFAVPGAVAALRARDAMAT